MINTALPEGEREPYLREASLPYGAAILEAFPGMQLRLAVLYYGGLDPYEKQHVVAHDDQYAYDAAGKRSLHAELMGAQSYALGLDAKTAAEILYTKLDESAIKEAHQKLLNLS